MAGSPASFAPSYWSKAQGLSYSPSIEHQLWLACHACPNAAPGHDNLHPGNGGPLARQAGQTSTSTLTQNCVHVRLCMPMPKLCAKWKTIRPQHARISLHGWGAALELAQSCCNLGGAEHWPRARASHAATVRAAGASIGARCVGPVGRRRGAPGMLLFHSHGLHRPLEGWHLSPKVCQANLDNWLDIGGSGLPGPRDMSILGNAYLTGCSCKGSTRQMQTGS